MAPPFVLVTMTRKERPDGRFSSSFQANRGWRCILIRTPMLYDASPHARGDPQLAHASLAADLQPGVRRPAGSAPAPGEQVALNGGPLEEEGRIAHLGEHRERPLGDGPGHQAGIRGVPDGLPGPHRPCAPRHPRGRGSGTQTAAAVRRGHPAETRGAPGRRTHARAPSGGGSRGGPLRSLRGIRRTGPEHGSVPEPGRGVRPRFTPGGPRPDTERPPLSVCREAPGWPPPRAPSRRSSGSSGSAESASSA